MIGWLLKTNLSGSQSKTDPRKIQPGLYFEGLCFDLMYCFFCVSSFHYNFIYFVNFKLHVSWNFSIVAKKIAHSEISQLVSSPIQNRIDQYGGEISKEYSFTILFLIKLWFCMVFRNRKQACCISVLVIDFKKIKKLQLIFRWICWNHHLELVTNHIFRTVNFSFKWIAVRTDYPAVESLQEKLLWNIFTTAQQSVTVRTILFREYKTTLFIIVIFTAAVDFFRVHRIVSLKPPGYVIIAQQLLCNKRFQVPTTSDK